MMTSLRICGYFVTFVLTISTASAGVGYLAAPSDDSGHRDKKVLEAISHYGIKYEQILAQRQSVWEYAKYLTTIPDDSFLEFQNYLDAHHISLPDRSALFWIAEVSRLEEQRAQAELDILDRKITTIIESAKGQSEFRPNEAYLIPSFYSGAPAWSSFTHEMSLNLRYARTKYSFIANPYHDPTKIFESTSSTLVQELERRRQLFVSAQSPQVPYLGLDDFALWRPEESRFAALPAWAADFNQTGFQYLLLSRKLRRLTKFEKMASGEKIFGDEKAAGKTVELTSAQQILVETHLTAFLDDQSKNDLVVLQQFKAELLVLKNREHNLMFDVMSIYEAKANDLISYFNGLTLYSLTSRREGQQRSGREMLEMDEINLKAYLNNTPLFCGDEKLLKHWTKFANVQTTSSFPEGDFTFELHFESSFPTEDILRMRAGIEIPFQDFIEEIGGAR